MFTLRSRSVGRSALIAAIVALFHAHAAETALRDGDLKFVFSDAAGDSLRPAILADQNREVFTFISEPGQGLWKIDLLDVRSKVPFTIFPADAQHVTTNADPIEKATTWSGFKKAGKSYDLEVVQRWRVRDRSGLRLKLEVRNHTNLALNLVYFPVLAFRPAAEKSADLKLVIPQSDGRLIADPFNLARHEKPIWRYGYPARGIMQFVGCYAGQSGFMIMDEDSRGFEKEYFSAAKAASQTMEVAVKRWPGNCQAPGESFTMDYYTVIRPVSGDWFDMATAYRGWALHQPWARKGPLAQAATVPAWYKEAPAIFVVHSNNPAEPFSTLTARVLASLEAVRYPAGVSAPLFWYTWQSYRPGESKYARGRSSASARRSAMIPSANVHAGRFFPARKGFKEAIGELERAHINPMIFMNTRLFDPGDPEAERWIPAVIKGPEGELAQFSPKHPLWDMCRYYGPWRENYALLSRRLIDEYGAKGIYLDSMGGASKRCFDPGHGHELGGGRYQGLAMHGFCEGLTELKAKHRDIVYVDENGPEYLMDVLDGTLSHSNVTPDKIPLRQAVYHDYWLGVGRSLSVREMATPNLFELSAASLFSCGQQLGRIEVSGLDPAVPQNRRKLEYLGTLINAKYDARQWLNFGQMLRPPALEAVANIQAKFTAEDGDDEAAPITVKAVLASCWRASDGSVALAMTNASDRQSDGVVILPLKEYLPGADSCHVTRLGGGEAARTQPVLDHVRWRFALPPYATSIQIFTHGRAAP